MYYLIFILLLGCHYIADYPLQGLFVAMEKNRNNPSPLAPWYQVLFAHSMIHGMFVAAITGVWWFALIEAAIHSITDDRKCSGKISFNQDQAVHITCKIVFLLVLIASPNLSLYSWINHEI
jgi:hypothetical protein